jgi:hypothetical protein
MTTKLNATKLLIDDDGAQGGEKVGDDAGEVGLNVDVNNNNNVNDNDPHLDELVEEKDNAVLGREQQEVDKSDAANEDERADYLDAGLSRLPGGEGRPSYRGIRDSYQRRSDAKENFAVDGVQHGVFPGNAL